MLLLKALIITITDFIDPQVKPEPLRRNQKIINLIQKKYGTAQNNILFYPILYANRTWIKTITKATI